jgi:DNA-binding Lrp family transcriptional regulator
MDGWWIDVERDILECLQGRGAMPVEEVARRLALSESAAASLLALLAREGKVRICSVEGPAPIAER